MDSRTNVRRTAPEHRPAQMAFRLNFRGQGTTLVAWRIHTSSRMKKKMKTMGQRQPRRNSQCLAVNQS